MQDDLETFQRLSQGIKGEDCETSHGLRPGCNCDVLFLIHLIYWALFTHTCSPRGKNNSGLGMQFPFLRTTRQRTTAITSVTMADVIVGGEGGLSSVSPVQPWVLLGCFPANDPVCLLLSSYTLLTTPDAEEWGPSQESSRAPLTHIP